MATVGVLTDADFQATIEGSDLPVLVDFWAPWCGPCRMLAPVLDRLAEANAGKVHIYKINVDENPKTAQAFGVMSIPTIIFFKNGEKVHQTMGALPQPQLQAAIDQL